MRTVNINYNVDVYKYDELSEDAKDEAKRWYLEGKEAYWFKNDCEEILHCEFPNSELKVEFSLSYCQGDGLNIYGSIDLLELWNKLDKSKYTDKEKKFMEYALKEYSMLYDMPSNCRYGYCMSSLWDFTENIISDMEYANLRGIKYDVLEKFDEDCKEYMEKLCSDFESDGYAYFYEVDDDEMIDMCEANEWEFTADGKIF